MRFSSNCKYVMAYVGCIKINASNNCGLSVNCALNIHPSTEGSCMVHQYQLDARHPASRWFLNYDSPFRTITHQLFKCAFKSHRIRWSIIIPSCRFKKHRYRRRSRLISSPRFMAAGWTLISSSSSSIFSSCCLQGLFNDQVQVWREPRLFCDAQLVPAEMVVFRVSLLMNRLRLL